MEENIKNLTSDSEVKVDLRVMQPPLVLADDDGIRPAGQPNECFYCKQRLGQPHKLDCVILNRKVKVRYSYVIEIEVPHFWDKESIEFHRNDSSWCAHNSLAELKEYGNRDGGCLCGCFSAEVLEIPEVAPYRKNKNGEVVA
jgi:hypothetical protein